MGLVTKSLGLLVSRPLHISAQTTQQRCEAKYIASWEPDLFSVQSYIVFHSVNRFSHPLFVWCSLFSYPNSTSIRSGDHSIPRTLPGGHRATLHPFRSRNNHHSNALPESVRRLNMSGIHPHGSGIAQLSSSSAVSRKEHVQNLEGDGLLQPEMSKIDSAESLNNPSGQDAVNGITGHVRLRTKGHQRTSTPTQDHASARSTSPRPINPVISIATTALSTYLKAVFMCLLATWLAVREIWCEARDYIVKEKVNNDQNVESAANALGSGGMIISNKPSSLSPSIRRSIQRRSAEAPLSSLIVRGVTMSSRASS